MHGVGHAGEGVGARELEGCGGGDEVGLEAEGAGVQGLEVGFCEGEFGHGGRLVCRGLGIWGMVANRRVLCCGYRKSFW